MEIKDLIITPIFLLLFTVTAYVIRPYFTNSETRRYFLPALWARFIGALALGLLYQYYYSGGDTYKYFEQGTVIYGALIEDPEVGLKLLSTNGQYDSDTFPYASQMYWFSSPPEFFIVKVLGFLSVFTYNSYASMSLFFAFYSFIGIWLIFSCIQSSYPSRTNFLAFGVLFLPTVVFWGSGILKDSVALGSLGIAFWAVYQFLENKRYSVKSMLLFAASVWIIFSIKLYILMCFLPSVIAWWYLKTISGIKNRVLRFLIVPVILLLFSAFGYYFLNLISKTSELYNLNSIAERSYITSYDIRYYTGKNAGSGYDIGEQDGTWQTLVKLGPAAVNVTLFRPYLWEIKNPLMLLSSLESIVLLILSIRMLPKVFKGNVNMPLTAYMFIFSVTFAFAVGVSTYNFGTLSRYKVPLLPFYVSLIYLLSTKEDQIKR